MQSHEEKARKTAYDILLNIRSSLRDSSCLSSDGPYQKLINMVSASVISLEILDEAIHRLFSRVHKLSIVANCTTSWKWPCGN